MGSLSRGGVSVQGAESLFRDVSVQRDLYPEGSLSRGSLSGDLCLGGLCLEGLCSGWLRSLSRGSLSRGSLSRGISFREPPATVLLRAGGTHPTGMHSCYLICVTVFCVTNHSKTLELSEIFEGEIP